MQEKVPPVRLAALPLQLTLATPEVASDRLPVTVTEALEKEVPSAGEITVIIGEVLSILRVALALALLPDASVTVPLTT